MRKAWTVLMLAAIAMPGISTHAAEMVHSLSPSVDLVPGPINGVQIERNGRTLAVYGDPTETVQQADMVLFTHSRRDVVWAGRGLVERGARAIVPALEAEAFSNPTDFWKDFTTARYHDYHQQTTKVPVAPLKIKRTVKGGDSVQWQGLSVSVLDTPGYTRGAVTYLLDIDNLRYAFVGDAIYGDGHLLDLYSLQDAVADANIRGYHGYAGRIGDLIASLRAILAQSPDILLPARGPVIRNPRTAIDKLIARLQAVYTNYLSINAGRWYFRDRYDTLARRALIRPVEIPWMKWGATKDLPSWVIPIQNSRLVLSEGGVGWLIDCGSQGIINELKRLRDAGRLTSLEGLFITHYHDDHTDSINPLLAEFPCPVHVTPLMADILRHPRAYRMPAMTSHPVADVTVMPDQTTMVWREFQLTFYDYPGQTLYHDALLVEHEQGQKIFLLGDSFTPSGIDDYCLLNRNLLHEGKGYFYCLDVLVSLPSNTWLVNEHVVPTFRFAPSQLAEMRSALTERKRLLAELFPWDEANYGIDERWARLDPYGQTIRPGQKTSLAIRILNHSGIAHEYTVTPHAPAGFRIEPESLRLTVGPRQEDSATFTVSIPSSGAEPLAVITADIAFDSWDLRHWCEVLLEIEP